MTWYCQNRNHYNYQRSLENGNTNFFMVKKMPVQRLFNDVFCSSLHHSRERCKSVIVNAFQSLEQHLGHGPWLASLAPDPSLQLVISVRMIFWRHQENFDPTFFKILFRSLFKQLASEFGWLAFIIPIMGFVWLHCQYMSRASTGCSAIKI